VLLGVALLLGGDLEYGLGVDNLYGLLVAGAMIALTSLTLFELLQSRGTSGGSYGVIAQTAGGPVSFLTGWLLVSAYGVLAADLLRSLGVLVAELTAFPFPPAYLSLLFLAMLLLRRRYLGGRGGGAREILISLAILGFTVLLVGVLLSDVWSIPRPPKSFDPAGMWREAGRLVIVFLAIEAGLSSRRPMHHRWISGVRSAIWSLLSGLALMALPLAVISGFPEGVDSIWQLATRATRAPIGLAVVVELGLFGLSTEVLLSGAFRTLREMGNGGRLPPEPARVGGASRMIPGAYVVLALSLSVATVLSRTLPMLEFASGMILLVILIINLVGIFSRSAEHVRRRRFNLPLYPLVPALAAGVAVSLLVNLWPLAEYGALLWGGLGLLAFIYIRRHQAPAREDSGDFGAIDELRRGGAKYRILLPLASGGSQVFPLQMAFALARQLGGEVLPLRVIPMPGTLDDANHDDPSRTHWDRLAEGLTQQAGVNVRPITCQADSVANGVLETAMEEGCDLLLLPSPIGNGRGSTRTSSAVETILSLAPCDAAVLAYEPSNLAAERTSGGSSPANGLQIENIQVLTPDDSLGSLEIELGMALAREFGARADASHGATQGSGGPENRTVQVRFFSLFKQAFRSVQGFLIGDQERAESPPPAIDPRPARSDEEDAGVAGSSAHADLIVVGASQEGLLDQLLFGSVPIPVEIGPTRPVILVRPFRGLPRLWLQRGWNSIAGLIPKLSAEQQHGTYKRLERGARPDVDFFVMMGLSATIGTIGLLLNSGAVIIGAMLVAPLLTPFLAFSLAISTGDLRLLRLAVESSMKGIFVAVGIGLTIGALASLPLDVANLPEIASRTRPNLLDLGVALAAGAAGAYAVGRKEVATALPGVAIAAALVPPLAVVGINLAAGYFDRAGGAALLVLTNLIAISMAGSITLLLLGFRPAAQAESKAHFRTGLAATVVLMMIVVVPLATVLVRSIQQSALEQTVASTLQRRFESIENAQVAEVGIESVDRVLHVSATVYSSSTEVQVRQLGLVDALESQTGSDVELSLVLIPRLELDNAVPNDRQLFDWRNRDE
jgi:uncharacterized hydrophobic protein (TIGR00271 family)